MRGIIWIGSMLLAVILFGIGHAIAFLTTMLAMAFDLPGPYADDPTAWLWFAISVVVVLAVSVIFCRWFARRVERQVRTESTFE